MSTNSTEDKVLEVALELTRIAPGAGAAETPEERQRKTLESFKAAARAVAEALGEIRKM